MLGVFEIGDGTGEPMLAYRATAQGERVAEIVAGARRAWDKRCLPAVCFTDPEIVSVVMVPKEARAARFETKVAHFPFAANGRAMTLADESGFIRVVGHATTHEMLGVQATGRGISQFASSFTLAIEMGGRLEDFGATIHARPTLGEGFQKACLHAGTRQPYLTSLPLTSEREQSSRRDSASQGEPSSRAASRVSMICRPTLRMSRSPHKAIVRSSSLRMMSSASVTPSPPSACTP